MAPELRFSPWTIRISSVALLAVAVAGCASTEAAEITKGVVSTEPAPVTAGLSVTDLAAGEYDGSVEISVGDAAGEGVQVVFREIVLTPGARTGRHCHHGQLVAVVAEGEFTHYAPVYEDGVHVYRQGDAIVEGAEYVHEGANEGSEDVVLWVTYLVEDGQPLAETDPSRCAD